MSFRRDGSTLHSVNRTRAGASRSHGIRAALVVVLGLTLAACTSTNSSLSQSASDAAAAVSTAELAVSQQARDRTFLPTTQTALSDSVKALSDAEASAARVQAQNPSETSLQKRTLTEIRSATDAVLTAQRRVADDAASVVSLLTESAKQLRSLSDELEKMERKQ
jgi:hypothetical protein